MKKFMRLQFPLSADLMTTVRLATGGLCALADFGIDDAEDCKVCVTESLLLLRRAGAEETNVEFSLEDSLFVRLESEFKNPRRTEDEEISIALLNALVEDFKIVREGDFTRISFHFQRR